MAAYDDVNGLPATEQTHVNNDVVKGEWGYRGLIMSDWFAAKSAGPAANGGLHLVMPGPAGPWGDALVAAVHAGEVDEAVIMPWLSRVDAVLWAGLVGHPGGRETGIRGRPFRRLPWPLRRPGARPGVLARPRPRRHPGPRLLTVPGVELRSGGRAELDTPAGVWS